MFVHDTHKGSPDVTGKSPENVESSSSNKPKTERNSPKTVSSNVSIFFNSCVILNNLLYAIIGVFCFKSC
jgi:hypothetical protein